MSKNKLNLWFENMEFSKKTNIVLELSKRPNNFALLDLRDLYEDLSGISLHLATKDMLIYLIIDHFGVTSYSSKTKASSILAFKKNFSLYIENEIECDDITSELVHALQWMRKEKTSTPCTLDLLKSVIESIFLLS